MLVIKMESKTEHKSQRNYPPRVGEWSYYDYRSYKKRDPYWIINIEGREEDKFGCHYSMTERNEEPFISCCGKITTVKYMLNGELHY
tara:strand:- start:1096 stop:1356 length:261 start_codon:yes stop_codon:yes gene_type:complete